MQKRRLDIDHLTVESFATEPVSELRGTVQGQQTGPTACNPDTCASGRWTCLETCDVNATCGLSCNPTCVVTLGACCPPES